MNHPRDATKTYSRMTPIDRTWRTTNDGYERGVEEERHLQFGHGNYKCYPRLHSAIQSSVECTQARNERATIGV